MAKFRTKVVEADALQYTYPASEEMKAFCGNAYYSEDAGDATHTPEMGLMIDDACHIANEGDWVVKMYTGELEVMCDEKFQQLCEVVCDDLSFIAKSKTEDLRDILPRTFNNPEDHW